MKGEEKLACVHRHLAQGEESALTFDGFDEAIVGVGRQYTKPPLVVYDYSKMVQILMKRDKMSYGEAIEYIDFNTAGAWMGDSTPFILNRVEELET